MKNQFLSYFLGLIFRIYKILKNCSNNNTQPDVSYFLVPNSNIIKAGQIRLVNNAVPSIFGDSETSDCEHIDTKYKKK